MTQHELIIKYIEAKGYIIPAKLGDKDRSFMGDWIGSQADKRCREMRNMIQGKWRNSYGKQMLRSEKEGKFEKYLLLEPSQTQETVPKGLIDIKEAANKAGKTLYAYMSENKLLPDKNRPAYKLISEIHRPKDFCCLLFWKEKTHDPKCYKLKQVEQVEKIKGATLFKSKLGFSGKKYMKIDPKTGRIAYHSLRLREDGGLDFVQYDFDGSVEYIKEIRPPMQIINYGSTKF